MQAMSRDPDTSEFLRDVIEGLGSRPKTLKPKWFYDAEGSRLFEAITRTREYYPTRAETALLKAIAPEMADLVPPGAALVEYGSGSATKTRILLDALSDLAVYVPVDISPEPLAESAQSLRRAYPQLTVAPLEADFLSAVTLPVETEGRPHLGFFPGSTIGNFSEQEALAFLRAARAQLGDGSAFLVGFDLAKEPDLLIAAYDDAQGVTAAFDKNLLVRMRRELGAEVDPDSFRHEARWNADESRVEAHLVSLRDQSIRVDGQTFPLAAGETIHTENARKFTSESIGALAEAAGWRVERLWTSPPPAVALALLRAA